MFKMVKNSFSSLKKGLRKRMAPVKTKVVRFAEKHPLATFFSLLLILLAFIVIGNILRKPTPEVKTVVQPKHAAIYSIGAVPKVPMQAQLQKSQVITITTLTNGVVSQIPVKEGQQMNKGGRLISLASNYQGGNSASVQRQLAQTQYSQAKDTFDTQKEIVVKQKEQAEKNAENTEKLRQISEQSVSDTQGLLDLNNQILSSLDSNLNTYQATNSAGINNALILSTKQLKSQMLSATIGLRNQLKNTQYQTDTNNPPTQLSNLQKDITLQQLAIQEKAIEVSREISRLQLVMAQINEAAMFPSAPFAGSVQRIYVKVGQMVTPGTPLVSFSGNNQHITAVALVPEQVAMRISRLDASLIHIGNKVLARTPDFVSSEATHGQLFSVIYTIPVEDYDPLPDGGYLEVDIPIGYPDTQTAIPYIPLDSIFQTQEASFVYMVENGKVVSKKVELGNVFGRFVEVIDGLSMGDQVILDRSVLAGQAVVVE